MTSGADKRTEEAEKPPEKEPRGLAKIATDNPVVVVSLIGAGAYFVTRLAQTSFYSNFGLEPEDLGLGYTETLSRAAAGLLLLVLVAAIYTAALALVTHFATVENPAQRGMRLPRFKLSPWRVIEFISLALLFLAAWMPFVYAGDADSVREGNALQPAGVTWGIFKNPLGLRAEPVHVSWIDDKQGRYDFGSKQEEVMYLGRANGIAVFFDPRKNRTVRVPDSEIVIERQT